MIQVGVAMGYTFAPDALSDAGAGAFGVEPLEIEPECPCVASQVVVLQRLLVREQVLVHHPEGVLQRRGLGGGRGRKRVRVDVGQREVPKGEAKLSVHTLLDAFDLAIRTARVRAFVVAVLDKETDHPARPVRDRELR